MQDSNSELAGLYRAEYGDLTDIVMRVIGVTVGGLLLYLYTGWAISYLWGTLFGLVHAVQFPFLRSRLGGATREAAVVGGAIFIVVHASFIWLPAYLAANEDPALQLVGFLVITATSLYHIRRADTALWLIWAQIAVFSASLLFILGSHLPRIDEVVAQIGAIMVTGMVITYLTLTMLAARRARIDLAVSTERLVQEQKMSAIGRLAGGVAHDFNNILTVVQGNLELFEHLESQKERDAVLGDALAAAQRGESVVRQLLIYARKAPMQKSVVDINNVIEGVIGLARTMVPERIVLVGALHPNTSRTMLDETQLVTALLNLIKNAIDAMPDTGRLVIRVDQELLDREFRFQFGHKVASGHYAVITVRDTGNGIASDDLSKVIEPFFTTKEPGHGTGLGIPMVMGFVEDLGGAFEINSSKAGTTVALYLPLVAGIEETRADDARTRRREAG